jgi:hypothetical protein
LYCILLNKIRVRLLDSSTSFEATTYLLISRLSYPSYQKIAKGLTLISYTIGGKNKFVIEFLVSLQNNKSHCFNSYSFKFLWQLCIKKKCVHAKNYEFNSFFLNK